MSDTITTDDADLLFRDELDDGEMPTKASRRVVTAWTIVFAALVIAGAGFVAGVQMEKRNAPAATGLPGGFASIAAARANGLANGGAFPGAANGQAPTGTPPTGTPTTGGTTGEVKLVDGTNVYLTTSDGSTVKVTTSAASKVTKSVESTVSELAAGDTVTVQGTPGSDGTIAATSITQTP